MLTPSNCANIIRAKAAPQTPPWLLPLHPFIKDTMAGNTDTVEWRAIPDHDGYEVSSDGRVRSFMHDKKNGRFLKLKVNKKNSGHLKVELRTDGARCHRFVHQLVLEAFSGARPDGLGTRHLDGNPSNNHFKNLIWGTQQENVFDTVRHGNHNMARKTECKRGHPFDNENTYWTKRGYRDCRACHREVHRLRWAAKLGR